jgi:hypothetical protein
MLLFGGGATLPCSLQVGKHGANEQQEKKNAH